MNALDFVVIGAQKCATTALHSALSEHPLVAMPRLKEAPFFDAPTGDWARFCATHFGHARRGQRCGKASPQYMAGVCAPRRLAVMNPDLRIVAMVRDPIARAASHYKMAVRRETETRTFADAMAELLRPDSLRVARQLPAPRHANGYESEAPFYLAWGEYGRILDVYSLYFDPAQILIVEQGVYRRQPDLELDRILIHLGLDPGFRPQGLGQEVFKGGGERRLKEAARRRIMGIPGVRAAWNLVPRETRRQLRERLDQWNVKPGSTVNTALPELLEHRLRRHYLADASLLEHRFGFVPSWKQAYALRRDRPAPGGSQVAA